ncbi:MAG: 4Fe-4S binding protein [Actinomycetota bacterium]|nr:4Fe-4S binding protein [Actinomycetota bacterium]
MASPVWFVNLVKKTFPQRFTLARLTRVPLVGAFLDRWLFGGDDIVYLPKDRVVRVDREVAGGENVVLPTRVVEYFVEKANYHWIMNTCICREASGCRDYPIDLGCLFLGEAAMGINPRLGRRVSREEALEHVRRCREAGLFQLIGRNKLDTVWLNVRPGTRLLTICSCCPCCCLWRMIPALSEKISSKVHRMPGVEVRVTDRCEGCGTCVKKGCFVQAIRMEGDRAVIGKECRGCGHCVEVCPHGAIELIVADTSFMDSLVPRIDGLVDVT